MKRLLTCVAAACLGLILAALLLPNFKVEGDFHQITRTLLFAGVVLGLINFFIKPIIKLITLPLNIITLGLFSLVINIAIIWAIDLIFGRQIIIEGPLNLFLTSLIVSVTNILIAPQHGKD